MYAEAPQIAVRQDSGIKSVEDLRGKTISLGETNSGTGAECTGCAGSIRPGMTALMKPPPQIYRCFPERLKTGPLMPFSAPWAYRPHPYGRCQVGFPSAFWKWMKSAEDIMREHPFLCFFHDPRRDLSTGQKKEVWTIGVKSVLVAHNSLADMVNKITNSLFAHAGELKYAVWVDYEPRSPGSSDGSSDTAA